MRYEGEKIQRIEKAVVKGSPARPIVQPYGLGRAVWSPLPLEVGDSMTAIAAFYRQALALARVAPVFTATPRTPAVLILPSVFRDVVLYTFVSEADSRYSHDSYTPGNKTQIQRAGSSRTNCDGVR